MRLTALAGVLALLIEVPSEAQEVPPMVEAKMPLHLFRDVDRPVEMYPAQLIAGEYGGPFFLLLGFDQDNTALGPLDNVFVRVALGDYCQNEDSGVRAVLISDSTGQIWSGHRLTVRAGPVQNPRWAEGFAKQPDLLAALADGGAFTLALQDDQGRLWNAVTIDTLSSARREQLYAANLEVFRTTDPATVPVTELPPPPIALAPVPRRPAALPPPRQTCP
jgi:hypothetical protein